MAPVGLLLMLLLGCSLLVDDQLVSGAPVSLAAGPGQVFLSARVADSVLRRRQRRHNTGVFEEFMEGDLERECVEEKCDLEEAREVFEDDQKTTEFWAGYNDGDQCKSGPCQNQGVCKDHIGVYTCTCAPNFIGSHCEIATARRCDVSNGDCLHFCEEVGAAGSKCSCADGYRLAEDGLDCFPEVDFPCGRDALTVISAASRRSLSANATAAPPNVTSAQNWSDASSTASGGGPHVTPASSFAPQSTPMGPPLATELELATEVELATEAPLAMEASLATGASPLGRSGMGPDGLEVEDTDWTKRIVGGQDVTPGEIPWQVGLIARPSGQLFCGGSILSELWVITAAHCLVEGAQSFYVRAGEHNLFLQEGTEQSLEVLQQYLHPLYNATVSLYDHDVALLLLANPVRFSATARPICLGPKAFTEALVKEGSPGTVSGWGRLRFRGPTSSVLQKVELPFTERAECKDSSADHISRYMFCAGYYGQEKDSCQGDSGGPHANRHHDTWFLTGVVSWGEECAKRGKYGVYTRLSHYYRWIQRVMRPRTRIMAAETDHGDDQPDP